MHICLGQRTHVVCSEVVQRLGYLDLLLGVEKGIGKLFSLAKSTLNDLKAGDVAEEVADRLIWVP